LQIDVKPCMENLAHLILLPYETDKTAIREYLGTSSTIIVKSLIFVVPAMMKHCFLLLLQPAITNFLVDMLQDPK
jgi:hypothetical protein